MVDRWVIGVAERVSPESPVPVVRVQQERTTVGGAANVAANLAALGAESSIVGCVGDDAEGVKLRLTLEELGVDVTGLVTASDRRTTVKTRVVAQGQQIVRFDFEDDADVTGPLEATIVQELRAAAADSDAVAVQDYDKGVVSAAVIEAVGNEAARRAVPLVVDPKERHFFEFTGVTVFKPNGRELAAALGEGVRADDGVWMRRARERLKCETLLVTLGPAGMALVDRDGACERIPSVAREVFDVSGAGDTVTATMAVALAAGATHTEAARLANEAAAAGVARAGVATVTAEQLRARLDAAPIPRTFDPKERSQV